MGLLSLLKRTGNGRLSTGGLNVPIMPSCMRSAVSGPRVGSMTPVRQLSFGRYRPTAALIFAVSLIMLRRPLESRGFAGQTLCLMPPNALDLATQRRGWGVWSWPSMTCKIPGLSRQSTRMRMPASCP